jgi:hypothetical protein
MTLKPGNRQNTFKIKSLTDVVNHGIKRCIHFADTGTYTYVDSHILKRRGASARLAGTEAGQIGR